MKTIEIKSASTFDMALSCVFLELRNEVSKFKYRVTLRSVEMDSEKLQFVYIFGCFKLN